jgi:hypothetical protein
MTRVTLDVMLSDDGLETPVDIVLSREPARRRRREKRWTRRKGGNREVPPRPRSES